MEYETIPTKVKAVQQQGVPGSIHIKGVITEVNLGDWIVTWPNGRIEIFNDKDFQNQFRLPPKPTVLRRDFDGIYPQDRPLVTFRSNGGLDE